METVFGVANENAASTTLIMVNSVVQIAFLAVPTKLGGSALWMNWLMLGVLLGSIVPMLLLRAVYRRSQVDSSGVALASSCDAAGCI